MTNMPIHFALPDYLIAGLYLVIVVILGLRTKSGERKTDYLLAGRRLTLPLFVTSLVATWYGNILGVGEFIYTSGVAGWFCFSFTYYVSAILFALFVAGKIRLSGAETIPEQIEMHFGHIAGLIASIIVAIITAPAVYILILGIIVQLFTGLNLTLSIILSTLLTYLYIYKGGFKATVTTNTFQFILMYAGFGMLLCFTLCHFGSPRNMLSLLPAEYKTLTGNESIQYVIVWFVIALQTFTDPGFHQRCAAVNKPETAKRGIMISICCWIVFDFMTLSTGLYARAFFPPTTTTSSVTETAMTGMLSYPTLAQTVLPVAAKGFFMVTLLATVMSTLGSYALLNGASIGNDIIGKFSKQIKPITLTRIGMMISAVFSIVLATAIPSAVDLVYKTASIAVPGLFFPLIVSYSKKYTLTSKAAILVSVSSSGVSLLWTIASICNFSEIFTNTEPLFPGILLSLFIGILLIKRKNTINGTKSI